jgi:hypothetical protein
MSRMPLAERLHSTNSELSTGNALRSVPGLCVTLWWPRLLMNSGLSTREPKQPESP